MISKSKRPVKLKYSGTHLLEMSLLNKETAFSGKERDDFKLHGLLPHAVETIQEQAVRAYGQYSQFKTDIDKHIHLRSLQDTNETLFYHLVNENIKEMLPILYTPVIGQACERFSEIYRANRGIFVSYPNRHKMDEMLNNVTKRNVKVIVVTDGERILGLGDLGVGGMGIPIGKLSLYTACGGISPAYTLPIVLDAGTNNDKLLNDPLYIGWKNPRISGPEYDQFVEDFIAAAKRKWPNILIQFEDFAQKNALPILNKYREQVCCFNDDIQGTAVVTTATLLAASKALNTRLKDQRIVFLGAGSTGCGIARSIVEIMISEGLTESEAKARLFLVDRYGLLTDKMPNLLDFQATFAQPKENIENWQHDSQEISLLEVVKNAKPTILIGASAQPGLFTEEIVKTMYSHCSDPIIFPLSNPSSRAEALPEDLLRWTDGKAIIATGSPFAPVLLNERVYEIPQCNNSYVFPGIGLGVLSSKARIITDNMLIAASEALSSLSPKIRDSASSLLPPIESIREVSKTIAFEVAKAAVKDGVAEKKTDQEILEAIQNNFWEPEYREYAFEEKR